MLWLLSVWFVAAVHGPTGSGAGLAATDADSMATAWKKVEPGSAFYVTARCRLAEYYLNKRTVRYRVKAQNCLEEALRLRPEEPELELVLARVLYARKAYAAALELCDRVTAGPLGRQSPGLAADFWFLRGKIKERSAFKYKDMVAEIEALGSETHRLSLTEYGARDLLESAASYERALSLDPGHRDARMRLGLLYMEIERYDRMAELMEQGLRRNPRDTELLAYAAYAAFHKGHFQKAEQLYQRAFQGMDGEVLAAYRSVGPLFSDPDRHVSSDSFWVGQDPLLLTASDERRLEHFNRVTYANLRFATENGDDAGHTTERGRTWIRYGKPDYYYSVSPDVGLLGGAQVWSYGKTVLVFRDEYASGRHLLDNQSVLEEESLFRTSSGRFTWPAGRRLSVQSAIYQFRGASGLTELRAYFRGDPQVGASWPANETYDGGLFLVRNGRAACEQRFSLPWRASQDRFVAGSITLSFDPENGPIEQFAVELLGRTHRLVGAVRQPITLREFRGDTLMMSDLILSSQDGSIGLQPLFDSTVRTSERIYLYFELYHLLLNDAGRGRYRVETTIRERRRFGLRAILPFRNSGGEAYRVTSVFDMESTARDDRCSYGVDLRDLRAGVYDLLVSVTDLLSLHRVQSAATMRLEPHEQK
jgi:GWxTD domain-containing protein